MKKIFIILIVVLFIDLSIEEEKYLTNKIVNTFKCVFDSKKRIDDIISFIEKIFISDNYFIVFNSLLDLDPLFKDCFNTNIYEIIMKFINP